MKRPCVCLLCAAFLVLAACGRREAPGNVVVGGEMGSPVHWAATDASVASGIGHLISPDGNTPSMLSQKVRGLERRTRYEMSLQARAATTPTAQLSMDLYSAEHAYDSERQELLVPPHEIEPTYNRFSRIVETEDCPEEVELRVFTFSTVRITIDDMALVKK